MISNPKLLMKLENRVIILTGATQGIGRATAYALAKAGCRQTLVARREAPLRALANEIGNDRAIAVPADMGDTAQAAGIVDKTIQAFGRVDVVINNAAIGVRDPVIDLQEAEARRVMDVNYFGPLALIQAAIPHLKANAGGGLIINISSIVGRRAMPGIAGYCAAKAALEKMAESLRLELLPDNVRVSTVYPGVTRTRFNDNSLGNNQQGRGRIQGVPPERTARTILKTIQTERRDAFVTLFDWAFVTASALWPWLMDQLLSRRLR